jgi:signal transduction histidine kinase
VFSADGRLLVSTDPDPTEQYAPAPAAARSGRSQQVVTGAGPRIEGQVAIPLSVDDISVVLAAMKPIDDVRDATGVVTRAFIAAAAAGLVGALLVGLLLAGRLARRIRRLRDTALRVSEIGPVAELRPDSGRDEIGDLSRAFATMQERLREQEHARRAFVATASHELRTPLSSLRLMLDMLIDDLEADPVAVESARTQAKNAEYQTDRLSQLAAELLDLSRIDAGLPLRTELVELDAVLRSVIAELDVRLAEQERRIDVDPGDGHWAVGDPGSVAQIVRILLDNALRHAPAPGSVRVRIWMREGMATLAVEDDGPGVPPEDRDRIFERFARGSQATEGGFGLGLAIGRELARQMDGDLSLADSSGRARFVLELPGAPAP